MYDMQTRYGDLTRREFLCGIGASALGITALGHSLDVRGDTMTDKNPNLLFVMTDHQRADSIGMVQAGIEVTPNLNRLASRGVVFTRAYNTCPLCVPARTALATGKYPTKNGVVFNDWRGLRAGDHKPIHQCLAEAGYDVGHIGVHHIRVEPTLQERVQFSKWISNGEYSRYLKEQGIDEKPLEGREFFRKEVTENQNGKRVKVMYSNTKSAVWPHPAGHFKDSYFCQQAVEFINEKRNVPFALFVYLWAPHPPLRVPEPYGSRFDPQEIELPSNVDVPAEGEPPGRRRGIAAQLAEDVPMDEWRKAWAAHLGLVNLADAGIGRVLQALEVSGQGGNTIIVFTVDHGDHLGQHRMYQKMEMYEQAIKVPLIIRVPGAEVRTLDSPVSHLDLMPTLLDLVDIEPPDGLDGISLLESIVSGTPPPDRSVFCQYSGNPTVGDIRRAVITRRYKYIYDPADVPELYDLESDPLEMHNLAADVTYREVIQKLHQECKSWAEEHGDWVSL
jgi:arylsulfatase A-like enzyme